LGGCELYTSASGQGQVVDCLEEGKESSVPQIVGNFLSKSGLLLE